MSEILEYAFKSYGFLLRNGTTTPQDFAERIKETYDLSVPQNKTVYDEVIKQKGLIYKSWHGLEVKIYIDK